MGSDSDSDIDVQAKPKRYIISQENIMAISIQKNGKEKKTVDRKSVVSEDARKSTVSGKKIIDISVCYLGNNKSSRL